MNKRIYRTVLFALAISILLTVPAMADSYTVYVGYADGLRGSGFFPNPWEGDSGITYIGTPGGGHDAGAIMILNTGGTAITVSDISVNINGSALGDIWTLLLPKTIAAGNALIVTETVHYNFDTSDVHVITNSGSPCLGLVTDSVTCKTVFPTVKVTTVAGALTFNDTGHVLDTEGFDFAAVGNESFAWRPIGSLGGPAGGNVPEPASLVLLASVAGFIEIARRRKLSRQ